MSPISIPVYLHSLTDSCPIDPELIARLEQASQDPTPAGYHFVVRVPGEPERRVELPVQEVVKVGKLPSADLALAHSSVARMHAVIETDDKGRRLIDLGSLGGSLLEGKVVVKQARVPDRCTLQFGDVEVDFEAVGVAPVATIRLATALIHRRNAHHATLEELFEFMRGKANESGLLGTLMLPPERQETIPLGKYFRIRIAFQASDISADHLLARGSVEKIEPWGAGFRVRLIPTHPLYPFPDDIRHALLLSKEEVQGLPYGQEVFVALEVNQE